MCRHSGFRLRYSSVMSRKVTGKVVLQGLEFHARHGVFEVEGVLGARFVVDAELHYPFAHIPDDLEAAVNYAEVYELIREEVTERQHQLIEVLAAQVARRLLTEQPKLQKVSVKVHKPFAPVAGIFRDIYAELEMDREELAEKSIPKDSTIQEYMKGVVDRYEQEYKEVKENKENQHAEGVEDDLHDLEYRAVFDAVSNYPYWAQELDNSYYDICKHILEAEEALAEETGVLFNHNHIAKLYAINFSGRDDSYQKERFKLNEMLYQYGAQSREIENLENQLQELTEREIIMINHSEKIALKAEWVIQVRKEIDIMMRESLLCQFTEQLNEEDFYNWRIGSGLYGDIKKMAEKYDSYYIDYRRSDKNTLYQKYIEGKIKYNREDDNGVMMSLQQLRKFIRVILDFKKELIEKEREELKNKIIPLLRDAREKDQYWSQFASDQTALFNRILIDRETAEPKLEDPDSRLVYIALGANLGEPLKNLRWAYTQLQELGTIINQSRIYRTKPLGVTTEQPDYYNAALLLQTLLSPRELLTELHRLEAEAGRVRTERWEARPLDLDMIAYYYADGTPEISDDPVLILPHPRAWERTFVLFPLADMNPSLTHPVTGETLEDGIKKALGDEAQRDIVQIKEFRWLSREEDDDEFLEDELEEDPEND